MKSIIITAIVSFAIGHYWKQIIQTVKSILPKKK